MALIAFVISVVSTIIAVKAGGAIPGLVLAVVGLIISRIRGKMDGITARDFIFNLGVWFFICGVIGFIVGLINK